MARVAQPRHDREQPIEGRLSVRHSHGCPWDREQDFARRYGDCDAIECSTLARTSGQVDRGEIRRKFVRLSEEGVSCELVSGNPDFNVRKKRTGVQKPSLISILIRFNDY